VRSSPVQDIFGGCFLRGPIDGKKRAKLIAELDREARWFQKTVRRYRTREWARDMRSALGISLRFLTDETQVATSTIYRAEQEEKTGSVTIGELEALAEAMECKLVYAIVPQRGTVAELAERRREHPRKTRTEREKEQREYEEMYAKEVERIRKPGPGGLSIAEMSAVLLKKRAERIAREGTEKLGPGAKGTESAGAEGQVTVRTGTDGSGEPVRRLHSPGVQKLMNEVSKYDVGALALEKVKQEAEEWERKHPKKQETGNGEEGPGLVDKKE